MEIDEETDRQLTEKAIRYYDVALAHNSVRALSELKKLLLRDLRSSFSDGAFACTNGRTRGENQNPYNGRLKEE